MRLSNLGIKNDMAVNSNYQESPKSDLDSTPQSQEAEQALLGSLLYDNEVYHRVSGIVKAKHFYNPIHVRIFDSIAVLIERGNLADAIVLKNRFSQDETLVDIGGVEYLALLLDNAPSSSAAPEYAKLIFDLAIRRELIRLGDEIKNEATDPDNEADAHKQIINAEGQLYNLAELGGTQNGFIDFQKGFLSWRFSNAFLARFLCCKRNS